MRVVRSDACHDQSRKRKHFSNDMVYMEKYTENPATSKFRWHGGGEATYLSGGTRLFHAASPPGVVEEAPALALRRNCRYIGERCAKACVNDYRGAGVRFLFETASSISMNTRIIQVERRRFDQERLHRGGSAAVGSRRTKLSFRGHAVECRINAEDRTPSQARAKSRASMRWRLWSSLEISYLRGATVPPYYDS